MINPVSRFLADMENSLILFLPVLEKAAVVRRESMVSHFSGFNLFLISFRLLPPTYMLFYHLHK